jgi:hypothetical protein
MYARRLRRLRAAGRQAPPSPARPSRRSSSPRSTTRRVPPSCAPARRRTPPARGRDPALPRQEPDDRYADMNDLEAALCEAQIAAGLRTDWDDLPLPEVDPERLARMRPHAQRPSPSPSAAAGWSPPASPPRRSSSASPSPSRSSARAPPTRPRRGRPHRRGGPARRLPHQLRRRPHRRPHRPDRLPKGPRARGPPRRRRALADQRGADLRQRFSAGLIALGDKYWDVSGARPFAVEYYIWARTFDPEQPARHRPLRPRPRRLHRTSRTRPPPAASASPSCRPWASSAPSPTTTRLAARARVDSLLAGADLSLRNLLAVDEGLRGAGVRPPERGRASSPRRGPDRRPPTCPGRRTALRPTDAPRPPRASRASPRSPAPSATPKRARELADEGMKALQRRPPRRRREPVPPGDRLRQPQRQGAHGPQRRLLRQRRQGEGRAIRRARRRGRPGSRASNLKLGDAYYNVLRYRDALKHYEKALELGETSAQGRIDKVKARIGG